MSNADFEAYGELLKERHDLLTKYHNLQNAPPSVPTTPTDKGTDNGGGGTPGSTSGATTSAKPQDPNALIGPAGYGTQNFLQPTGTWPYTIDFENDGSAAAQNVTVTEHLDPNLDWSTFQLGSFGFGPVNVFVPAGLTEYQTTVSYQNTDGSPVNVLVTLDFNVQTGLLTTTFISLDPTTGEDPSGVFDGFLYPDDALHNGEGYVQYTVQPKAALATGVAVTQQASVVFDTNAALATAPFINSIDSRAPTSTVTRPAGCRKHVHLHGLLVWKRRHRRFRHRRLQRLCLHSRRPIHAVRVRSRDANIGNLHRAGRPNLWLR